MVGGLPVPEVNRIVNAFIAGAKEINPDVDVKTTFINSWFTSSPAKEAALAQIDAGADVLFAERFGVIEAAAEKGLYAFGNMSDQKELAPEHVVSSPVWNMEPTVQYIIKQVGAVLIRRKISRRFLAWSPKAVLTARPDQRRRYRRHPRG